MLSKQAIQCFGENYVVALLKARNFHITEQNARRRPFEFDILCTSANTDFIIEVRTTTNHIATVIDLFPTNKLITLIKGRNLYFPSALLICARVYMTQYNQEVQFFNSIDLL